MPIAIKVENLSKEYRLGTINHGMLYKDLQAAFARKRGKPDPHAKINAERFTDNPDSFWALKDLSFEIEQGDRVGVIGRNGAGKSTLLKILSRITAPTKGLVKIRGRITSLLEVGAGFHPELTGRENVYLNGAILGMKKKEIAKKFDEIVAFSEVEKFIDTPVKRYSSGMSVRLAFSVAAHLDSEILLADEVLAVGDAAFQKKCLGKMEEVSRDLGRTVLFVSHNMSFISTLCQTGMLLSSGRLFKHAGIEETISEYLASSTIGSFIKPESSARKGVWIESISLRDEKGNGCETIKNGTLFSFRITLKSDKRYDGLELRIRGYDSQLRPFWAFTNAMYRKNPIVVDVSTTIDLLVRLPAVTFNQILFDIDIRDTVSRKSLDIVERLSLGIDFDTGDANLDTYSNWPVYCSIEYQSN